MHGISFIRSIIRICCSLFAYKSLSSEVVMTSCKSSWLPKNMQIIELLVKVIALFMGWLNILRLLSRPISTHLDTIWLLNKKKDFLSIFDNLSNKYLGTDHDLINYRSKYIVLNNCQLNYKKSLLKVNQIAKTDTPKAT